MTSKMNKILIDGLALRSYEIVGDYSHCTSSINVHKFAELLLQVVYDELHFHNQAEAIKIIEERTGYIGHELTDKQVMRSMALELLGVAEDAKHQGFDEVSARTVQRVIGILSARSRHE